MSALGTLRALRYQVDRIGDLGAVLAPPYDVIAPTDAARLRARHENNIVRLTVPRGEGDERYERASSTLNSWIGSGVLARDERPAIYAHRHTFTDGEAEHRRLGLWALLRLSPFEARVVLPHERTMGAPKADRLALMRACRAQLSPIFLICSDPDGGLAAAIADLATGEPDESGEFPAGDAHGVWRVDDPEALDRLGRLFGERAFLIADGHHRYETALMYRDALIAAGAPETGRGAHEFVLAYIVAESDPGLLLLATHRVITGEEMDWAAAILSSSGRFEIDKLEDSQLAAAIGALETGEDSGAFILVTKRDPGAWRLRQAAGEERMIASVAFHEVLLEQGLGLSADEQVGRTAYLRDPREAIERVRSGAAEAAALLAAPSVAQVREAALLGRRLPPKTTYFWPKVPTGIAIHPIDPEDEVRLL